jgi:hypothetical protein
MLNALLSNPIGVLLFAGWLLFMGCTRPKPDDLNGFRAMGRSVLAVIGLAALLIAVNRITHS